MNPLVVKTGAQQQDNIFNRISGAIYQQGYLVIDNIFSDEQLNSLFIDIKESSSQAFHSAGIGREQEHQLNRFVRGDRIHWLERHHQASRFYFDWIEQLRSHLNQELFLGLFDYECHYAHYPKGTFYKKHLDAFKGSSNRVVTTILYLNPNWQSTDGGELVLYAQDGESILQTVQPTFGTMVIFLSEEFPHEVLPSNCSRYSLTGWYRVNGTNSISIDPGR